MNTATELFDCRKAYASTLEDIAARDPRLVVVVNDSVGSSNLGRFQELHPDQIVNVGIAEQDQVGIAAGLENGGRVPVVSCAGSFLSARAMEQIKIDAAYSERHIVLCAQSPGLAYGQLGATHHSCEDLAWMRVIPNMTVIAPADPLETAQALRWAVEDHDGPVYIRVSRMKVPVVHDDGYRFEPGRATVLREGSDAAVFATGVVVHRALAAAEALADEGLGVRVVSVPCVKPLDEEAVLDAARTTGGIVTAEEGTREGGLGGAVAEVVGARHPTRVVRIGVPDAFAPTGSEAWLLDAFGISAAGIGAAVRAIAGR